MHVVYVVFIWSLAGKTPQDNSAMRKTIFLADTVAHILDQLPLNLKVLGSTHTSANTT